jgi:translation initiation factor IF-2
MAITPGTLGGMGRMPGSMGGGQFGGAAGSMGGPRRRRFTGAPQGSGQITPGTLGGMGTAPGSVSQITPGAIGDPGWRQDLGNRFDAAVGSMSQPSPITPGVLGGGGVAPTFNPTGSGAFGGAFGGMGPGGAPDPGPGPGPDPDPPTNSGLPGEGFEGQFSPQGPAPIPQQSMPVPYTPPPQRSPGFLDQGSMADERSRQMDMARDWQMGINKNAQIGGVPVDASQMWQLVEARNRMAAGGGPAGPQWGAPPPPMSSPGFPGMRPTGGFPGRPPMPPGIFPPGFRRGRPGLVSPEFRGGPPGMFPGGPRRPTGMFPGGPQRPLNGGPPRYPAGHPMGGGMGQMALRGLYGRMA